MPESWSHLETRGPVFVFQYQGSLAALRQGLGLLTSQVSPGVAVSIANGSQYSRESHHCVNEHLSPLAAGNGCTSWSKETGHVTNNTYYALSL